MKLEIKQKKINYRMNEMIFNSLVRMRLLAIQNKFQPTKLYLLFIKLMMVISTYQKIQIITEKNNLEEGKFQLQEALMSIYKKYSIQYIQYLKDEQLLTFIFITQLIYFTMFFVVLIFNQNHFFLLKLLLNYYQIVHHYIILFPILNISFFLMTSTNNILLPSAVILLTVAIELVSYFNNYQNKIIETEGNLTYQIADGIYLFLLLSCSILIQKNESYLLAQITLLLAQILLLTRRIHNYHFNSHFNFQVNSLIVSYILTLLFDQTWYLAIIIHAFITNLIYAIKLNKIKTELTEKRNQMNLFKYQIYDNQEFQYQYQKTATFQTKIQRSQILQYEQDILQQDLSADNVKILQNIFKFQQTKLYLNLIKASKVDFTYYQLINLEANLQNISKTCEKIINSKLGIQDFVSSLKVEQENFQNLINFIDKKIGFYHVINKEIPLDQYLRKFTKYLNKMLSVLENFQEKFENQYDILNGKLRSSKHSDRVSLNIVIAYISVFYENPYQIRDLLKKSSDLLSYDKFTNYKMEQNDMFLISTSLFKQPNLIINPNNKRLQKIFGESLPQQFSDLLPFFQIKSYENYIEEFIENGFEKQQTINIFLNQNGYILECELQIFVSIQNDDIILNSLVILKNQPNHIIIFDEKGKILGISKEIFTFLRSKTDDKFTKELQVHQFVQKGMIQYYVSDINAQIKYLIQLDNLGKWQNQISFTSKWQFPINHKLCLKQSQTATQTNENAQNSEQYEFESPLNSQYNDQTIDFLKKSTKILIDINQDTLKNKIQYTQGDHITFEACLRFSFPLSKNQNESYFILKFQNIDGQQEEKQTCKIIEKYQLIECQEDDVQSNSLQYIYSYLFGKTHHKILYTPLKYNILTVIVMILITSLSLLISYQLNYDKMLQYRNDVNFFNTPQAMTFNYGGPFFLQWNYYCIQNNLYTISPFLEDRRQFALDAAFGYWKGVHNEFSLNLSMKSKDFGYPIFNITRFKIKNQENTIQYDKEIQQTNLFEFYAILREAIVRQVTNTIPTNYSSFDPEIFQTIGLLRYNMLPMLKFHNIVLDEIITQTTNSFEDFENKTLIFCVLSAILILVLLFILFLINFVLLGVQTKIIKLLQYISTKSIYEQEIQYEKLKQQFINLMIDQNETLHVSSFQLGEKIIHSSEPKTTILKKIDSYKESYSLLTFLTIFIGVELIMFIFGSKFVAQLYNSQYQNSLITTMQFLKLKTRLDCTVLFGELIKTEHLINNNTDLNFTNQTENVQFFTENLNQVLNLANEINDNFITTDSYNNSFQTRLISIFNQNLCTYYTEYMSFCQSPDKIQNFYLGENYTTLIKDGILGIIGNLNQIAQSEFSFEITQEKYEFDSFHSKQYLDSQKHMELFLWYFIEIEYCIFLCFLDIFEETLNISANLSKQILVYLLSSSAAFLLMTLLLSGFWVFKQYKKLNQLKLMITLIPRQILIQRSFNKLLQYHLSQIK